jgi:predicted nucleic acid-binding protein
MVVDSSVWIDFLNGRKDPHVERLRAAFGVDEIIVGDLMLCEVLQGLGRGGLRETSNPCCAGSTSRRWRARR